MRHRDFFPPFFLLSPFLFLNLILEATLHTEKYRVHLRIHMASTYSGLLSGWTTFSNLFTDSSRYQEAFVSPFSPYTKTNYVPDERERSQILEILAKPVEESKRLEEEILNLEETLKAFLLQREELQNTIDQYERLTYSFRRVSDDVLREIFLHCLPSDHNPIMSIHEPPFALALVCQRWKSVVFETPRLWARIHIPLPIYPQPDGGDEENFQHTLSKFQQRLFAHCNAVHSWLSRSGACPLSISFNPSMTYPIQNKTHLMPYLETLLEFSSRWHTLELTVLTGDFSSFFAAIPASAVPILHSLNITFAQHWQDWNQPHSHMWPKSGFINTPSLRQLGFYHYPAPVTSLEVEWSRLTRLDIPDPRVPWQDKGLSMIQTHTLFSNCPNLVHLSIDVEDTGDGVYLFLPITLQRLESLDILDAASSLQTLLNVISFPSLCTIRFQSLFSPSPRRHSMLTTLISRTEPAKIKSLCTNLQMLTHKELMVIIHQTPNMTAFSNESSRRGPSDEQSLWLRNILDFPIDFIAVAVAILTPKADERLWPCLTHISLGKVRRLTDAAVLRFIEARMETEGVEKLQSVKIFFYRDMIEDIRPVLGEYIDGGLIVDFVYPSSRVAIPGSIRPRKSIFKRNAMFRP